jgi:ATP-binding cassette subfamily C protein
MNPRERFFWLFLTTLRALLSFFDLIGILAIGYVLTSIASFVAEGSDESRVLNFIGLEIPAVNSQTLPWMAAAILILFLAKAIFSILLTKRAAFFAARVEARSARTIAEISFGGDLENTRSRSREEVMFAIQNGSPSAFNTLINSTNTIVSEAFLFILICIGFLLVDPLATFVAITYFGLIAMVMQYFIGAKLSEAGKLNVQGSVEANTAISNLIAVFRELLVLGKREKYITDLYHARITAADSAATSYYLTGMPRYIIESALLVGISIFIFAQASTGDFVKSAGTIGVFLSGGFRLTAALLPLQNAVLTIKSVVPIARTAQTILEQSEHRTSFTDEKKNTAPYSPELLDPIGVEFTGVSFRYPGSEGPTISNISFKLDAGSQVALIGASGSGKSTIADLMCGVLSPSSGSIKLWVGTPDRSNSLLSRSVSYVPQKPGLVSGSIADNVALGLERGDVDEERVLQALSHANLMEVVNALPQGLETPLGKLQDGLSGGQMQRLGLARALYSQPGLLVMDEATSALDAESEAEIQRSLEAMKGKVTVVLIAHRLNTIQHADKVILVQGGSLKDTGTLQELILRNPSVEKAVELMTVDRDDYL